MCVSVFVSIRLYSAVFIGPPPLPPSHWTTDAARYREGVKRERERERDDDDDDDDKYKKKERK